MLAAGSIVTKVTKSRAFPNTSQCESIKAIRHIVNFKMNSLSGGSNGAGSLHSSQATNRVPLWAEQLKEKK